MSDQKLKLDDILSPEKTEKNLDLKRPTKIFISRKRTKFDSMDIEAPTKIGSKKSLGSIDEEESQDCSVSKELSSCDIF